MKAETPADTESEKTASPSLYCISFTAKKREKKKNLDQQRL